MSSKHTHARIRAAATAVAGLTLCLCAPPASAQPAVPSAVPNLSVPHGFEVHKRADGRIEVRRRAAGGGPSTIVSVTEVGARGAAEPRAEGKVTWHIPRPSGAAPAVRLTEEERAALAIAVKDAEAASRAASATAPANAQ